MVRNMAIRSSFGFGRVDAKDVVHKFGRSSSVGSASITPICHGDIYRTPLPSNATALRVKAGNAGDDAGGVGAREITFQGLDANGDFVTEAVATAGSSASANTETVFLRLFRAYVSKSGTHSELASGSHVAAIVIEDAAGGEDWCTIEVDAIAEGQTEIGCYTVPRGKLAAISYMAIHVDASKAAQIGLYKRSGILTDVAPFSALCVVERFVGVTGSAARESSVPIIIEPLTDILFMGSVAQGDGDVSVNFTITLVDE